MGTRPGGRHVRHTSAKGDLKRKSVALRGHKARGIAARAPPCTRGSVHLRSILSSGTRHRSRIEPLAIRARLSARVRRGPAQRAGRTRRAAQKGSSADCQFSTSMLRKRTAAGDNRPGRRSTMPMVRVTTGSFMGMATMSGCSS